MMRVYNSLPEMRWYAELAITALAQPYKSWPLAVFAAGRQAPT